MIYTEPDFDSSLNGKLVLDIEAALFEDKVYWNRTMFVNVRRKDSATVTDISLSSVYNPTPKTGITADIVVSMLQPEHNEVTQQGLEEIIRRYGKSNSMALFRIQYNCKSSYKGTKHPLIIEREKCVKNAVCSINVSYDNRQYILLDFEWLQLNDPGLDSYVKFWTEEVSEWIVLNGSSTEKKYQFLTTKVYIKYRMRYSGKGIGFKARLEPADSFDLQLKGIVFDELAPKPWTDELTNPSTETLEEIENRVCETITKATSRDPQFAQGPKLCQLVGLEKKLLRIYPHGTQTVASANPVSFTVSKASYQKLRAMRISPEQHSNSYFEMWGVEALVNTTFLSFETTTQSSVYERVVDLIVSYPKVSPIAYFRMTATESTTKPRPHKNYRLIGIVFDGSSPVEWNPEMSDNKSPVWGNMKSMVCRTINRALQSYNMAINCQLDALRKITLKIDPIKETITYTGASGETTVQLSPNALQSVNEIATGSYPHLSMQGVEAQVNVNLSLKDDFTQFPTYDQLAEEIRRYTIQSSEKYFMIGPFGHGIAHQTNMALLVILFLITITH